jgi:hypothetical protein
MHNLYQYIKEISTFGVYFSFQIYPSFKLFKKQTNGHVCVTGSVSPSSTNNADTVRLNAFTMCEFKWYLPLRLQTQNK